MEDWSEWSRYVLNELSVLGKGIEEVKEKLDELKSRQAANVAEIRAKQAQMHTSITLLRYKASVWGAAAGAIPGLVAAIVIYLMKG